MDIEKLTKSQIILLTLLISFVTSTATGVVTVSLMDQAPPAIAQTVNRVVEHTVEKIVPASQTASAAGPEKTVIIKESQLIADAVESTRSSIVRLYSSDAENPTFLGIGLVIDKAGMIVTDTAALGEYSDAVAEMGNGVRARAFVTRRDNSTALAYMRAATSTKDGKSIVWMPAALSGEKQALGSTVVMLAGKTVLRVENGIVTAIIPTDNQFSIIDTNIPQEGIMYGSPLISTDGFVVGVSSSAARSSSLSAFVPASAINPAEKAEKSAAVPLP